MSTIKCLTWWYDHPRHHNADYVPITALSTLWILWILTNFNSLSSIRWVLLLSTLSTFHRWINWGIKYLNNLPKITSLYVRSHLALSTTNSMRWVLPSSFCRWDTETEKTKLGVRTHHQEGEQLCLAPKTFQNLSVPPLPRESGSQHGVFLRTQEAGGKTLFTPCCQS